jgi:myo-inositol-1(or 4)-monophosphatase
LPAVDDLSRAELADDLPLLLEAAKEAGRNAMRFFRQSPKVWLKDGTSPVSEADYAVDKFLRETLITARPDYGWLSEETADGIARLSARRTFVVDPIDGTRGFLEGRSEWCVSLAVVEAGRPVAGVLECPARGETFSAVPGAGSFKNGARLKVRQPGLSLEIGGPKTMFDTLPLDFLARTKRVTYVPSLAYRVAMIADAALDASYVKPNAHDWDLAATDLILSEAGGLILDQFGASPNYGGAKIRHGALVAGSGELLAALVKVIAAGNA